MRLPAPRSPFPGASFVVSLHTPQTISWFTGCVNCIASLSSKFLLQFRSTELRITQLSESGTIVFVATFPRETFARFTVPAGGINLVLRHEHWAELHTLVSKTETLSLANDKKDVLTAHLLDSTAEWRVSLPLMDAESNEFHTLPDDALAGPTLGTFPAQAWADIVTKCSKLAGTSLSIAQNQIQPTQLVVRTIIASGSVNHEDKSETRITIANEAETRHAYTPAFMSVSHAVKVSEMKSFFRTLAFRPLDSGQGFAFCFSSESAASVVGLVAHDA